MIEQKDRMQWYVLTAIGGQEVSIRNALEEKMKNFGYDTKVKEFKVFTRKDVKEELFNKNSPDMPKSLKNTKTTTWEALPDGRYKRIKTKVVNRFPGYIFVCCDLDDDIWYAIRNTVGVLGFVGSTGKNTKPIPCATDEYERLLTEAAATEYASRITAEQEQPKPEVKKAEQPKVVKPAYTESPFKVGQTVVIVNGSFADQTGRVAGFDLSKGTCTIEIEFFGRTNSIEIDFKDLKLAE